jgi:hypothetical protein
VFSYLELIENIIDSEAPLQPPVPWIEIYPGAGAPLSNYIAELLERDAQRWLETNVQINPYYLFPTRG